MSIKVIPCNQYSRIFYEVSLEPAQSQDVHFSSVIITTAYVVGVKHLFGKDGCFSIYRNWQMNLLWKSCSNALPLHHRPSFPFGAIPNAGCQRVRTSLCPNNHRNHGNHL